MKRPALNDSYSRREQYICMQPLSCFGMHMDGFDNDPKGLPTGMTISVADIETIQFTNNFDGILRDGYGNPITLDLRDFRHQAHYGEKNKLF